MQFVLSYPVRCLRNRKGRTTVVIMGLALAVSLPLVVGMMFDSSVGALYNDLTQGVPDDVRLSLQPTTLAEASAQMVDFAESSTFSQLKFSLRYTDDKFIKSNRSDALVSMLAVDLENDWFLQSVELASGDLADFGRDRALVSRALATELHLTIGSAIEILDSLVNLDVEVAGIFHRLGYDDERAIIVSLEWLQESWNTSLVNEVGIILADGAMDVDEYAGCVSQLVSQLRAYFGQVNMRLERLAILQRERANIELHRQSMTLMMLLSLVAGGVATVAFVVVTYHEQLYETSLLKSMGMKTRQLVALPFFMTGVLTICGSALAVLFSVPASVVLLATDLFASAISGATGVTSSARPALRVQAQSVAAPIVIEAFVSVVAATYPAISSIRAPCIVGLHPRARQTTSRIRTRLVPGAGALTLVLSSVLFVQVASGTGITVFERGFVLGALLLLVVSSTMLVLVSLLGPMSHLTLLFAPWLHGFDLMLRRNLTRNRLRSGAVSCQFGVTVLVVLVLTVVTSYVATSAMTFSYMGNGSDILLSGYFPASTATEIANVEGVEHASSLMYYDMTQTRINGNTAVESAGQIRSWFIDPLEYSLTCRWEWLGNASRLWVPALAHLHDNPNCTIISSQVADSLQVSTNDTVKVEIDAYGEALLFNSSCLVVAVVDAMPGLGDLYTPTVILSTSNLVHNASAVGLIGERMLVRIAADSSDVNRVADAISSSLPEGLVIRIGITQEMVDDTLKQWATTLFTYESLASFSLALAGVTMAVIMISAVIERRFEYGILLANGMPWIRRLVIAEALTVGMMGFGMGAVLLVVLSAIGALGMVSLDATVMRTIAGSVLAVFMVVLVVSLLVGTVSSRYIEAKTPSVSLRTVSH